MYYKILGIYRVFGYLAFDLAKNNRITVLQTFSVIPITDIFSVLGNTLSVYFRKNAVGGVQFYVPIYGFPRNWQCEVKQKKIN